MSLSVRIISTLFCFLAPGVLGDAHAGDTTYFLSDEKIGSEASFNPGSTLLNMGFDITRSNTYDHQILGMDLATGFNNTLRNLAHPVDAIERTGGVREFIAHELLPIKGMTARYSQWVPNYFLHLLGEGMLYRKMAEWYEREGYATPRIWAMSTMLASALMNETVENGSFVGGNTDPIADLYFFNPMGWLLFSDDNVASFFSSTIEIGYWPGQPALALSDLGIYNAGESYFFRYDPGPNGGSRLFAYIGTEGMGGLTLGSDTKTAFTVAAGYRTTELIPVEENGARIMVASARHSNLVMGVFWEKNSSLLASAKVDLGFDPAVRVNIYPGVIPTGRVPFGMFTWASRSGGLVTGISIGHLPIGVGVLTPKPIGI
jgi:hypothetical protein